MKTAAGLMRVAYSSKERMEHHKEAHEKALENWGRSFSKLGIDYQGATMTLDLLDRKGKYSNGFCHWPHEQGRPCQLKPPSFWRQLGFPQASFPTWPSIFPIHAMGSTKTEVHGSSTTSV